MLGVYLQTLRRAIALVAKSGFRWIFHQSQADAEFNVVVTGHLNFGLRASDNFNILENIFNNIDY